MDSDKSSSRLSSTSRGFSFSTLAIWRNKTETTELTEDVWGIYHFSSVVIYFVQQVSLLVLLFDHLLVCLGCWERGHLNSQTTAPTWSSTNSCVVGLCGNSKCINHGIIMWFECLMWTYSTANVNKFTDISNDYDNCSSWCTAEYFLSNMQQSIVNQDSAHCVLFWSDLLSSHRNELCDLYRADDTPKLPNEQVNLVSQHNLRLQLLVCLYQVWVNCKWTKTKINNNSVFHFGLDKMNQSIASKCAAALDKDVVVIRKQHSKIWGRGNMQMTSNKQRIETHWIQLESAKYSFSDSFQHIYQIQLQLPSNSETLRHSLCSK